MGFKRSIDLVKDGQPVRAGTSNAPLRELQENINYLKDLFDAAFLGEAVFAREQSVESDAKVGQPVYYRSSTQRFERALARIDTDQPTGEPLVAVSAQVWGIVYQKHSATSADLLLFGYAEVDLAESVDDDLEAGVYYLSAQTPGKLVRQRPGVSVAVLKSDGLGRVFVQPQLRESIEDHRHYHFELVCRPAGSVTPPSPGDRHEIVDPDTSLEGWLPASHPTFEGKAPANASFGYNIEQAAWKDLWPPIPTASAYLEWDKGEDKTKSGQGVPLGSDGLCVLNADGIWWLSDCYQDVPWPVSLDTSDPDTEPESDESDEIECPRNLYMRMTLWFTRMLFKTSASVVTSLRAKEGSRISVTCYPTADDATTGDLELDLDLDFVSSDSDALGALVFKELSGVTFGRGYVVEAMKPSGNNVTMTGTVTRRTVPGDTSTDLLYQGTVAIGLLTDINGKELPVDLIRVTGVSEEHYLDLPALGMPPSQESEFRGKIRVPPDGVASGTQMKIRLVVLGRVDGTLPSLEISYRRVPAATLTPQTIPTTDTDLDDIEGVAIDADDYVQLESESFTIAAGDQVYFTVRRLSDGYTGEIQIIDQRGVLVSE